MRARVTAGPCSGILSAMPNRERHSDLPATAHSSKPGYKPAATRLAFTGWKRENRRKRDIKVKDERTDPSIFFSY